MFGAAVGAVDPSFVGSQVVIIEQSTGASRQTVVAGLVWLSAVVAAGEPGAKNAVPRRSDCKSGKAQRQNDEGWKL